MWDLKAPVLLGRQGSPSEAAGGPRKPRNLACPHRRGDHRISVGSKSPRRKPQRMKHFCVSLVWWAEALSLEACQRWGEAKLVCLLVPPFFHAPACTTFRWIQGRARVRGQRSEVRQCLSFRALSFVSDTTRYSKAHQTGPELLVMPPLGRLGLK